jgi:hypothetical protein
MPEVEAWLADLGFKRSEAGWIVVDTTLDALDRSEQDRAGGLNVSASSLRNHFEVSQDHPTRLFAKLVAYVFNVGCVLDAVDLYDHGFALP